MFINLDRYSLFESLKIAFQQFQYVFYDIDNVFRFDNEKTFTRTFVKNFIKINDYTRIKTFVDEKKRHVDNEKHFVVINEFDYKQLFELIILYVIAILTKMRFDFFINTFILIIDF